MNSARNLTTVAVGFLVFVGAVAIGAPANAVDAIPRIGLLENSNNSAQNEALEQSLREAGLIDGRTIAIERRSAKGEPTRLPRMAEELVRLKVALILAPDPPSATAARAATKTIPIVTRLSNDPVETGLIESFAHPGGNMTGVYSAAEELTGKRLELLREALPGLTRVAVLWDPELERSKYWYRETQNAANALGLQLQSVEVDSVKPDFEAAVRAAVKGKAQALITFRNPRIVTGRRTLVSLTNRYRLPAMFDEQAFVDAGGLMSYGANLRDLHRHLATYVDKILKGARPGDLPVEQPTKFELVVNAKTAKLLGITIPKSFLFRADRVIE